jgi:hypothetical protein
MPAYSSRHGFSLEPNGSVRFDASADDLLRTTNLPPMGGSAAFTVMGWWRLATDKNDFNAFVAFGTDINNCYLVETDIDGTTLESWNNVPPQVNGPALTVGRWYHIAATLSGAAFLVYVDGSLAITNAVNTFMANSMFRLGMTGIDWADANFADVRLWAAALTQSEIKLEMQSPAPVRRGGLNAWYRLSSAVTAHVDSSGNNYHLTRAGTLTTEPGPPRLTNAVYLDERRVNAKNRAWSIPPQVAYKTRHGFSFEPNGATRISNAAANFLDRTTRLGSPATFTLMGRFYFASINSSVGFAVDTLFDRGGTDNNTLDLLLFGNGTGAPTIACANWVGSPTRGTTAVATGRWYHIAYVFAGGTMKGYLNGAQEFSAAFNTPTADGLTVGSLFQDHSTTNMMNGRVCDVRLWDRALSADEVKAEAAADAPVNRAALNAWYPMRSAGEAHMDASGRANHLTRNGTFSTEPGPPQLTHAVTMQPFKGHVWTAGVVVSGGNAYSETVAFTAAGVLAGTSVASGSNAVGVAAGARATPSSTSAAVSAVAMQAASALAQAGTLNWSNAVALTSLATMAQGGQLAAQGAVSVSAAGAVAESYQLAALAALALQAKAALQAGSQLSATQLVALAGIAALAEAGTVTTGGAQNVTEVLAFAAGASVAASALASLLSTVTLPGTANALQPASSAVQQAAAALAAGGQLAVNGGRAIAEQLALAAKAVAGVTSQHAAFDVLAQQVKAQLLASLTAQVSNALGVAAQARLQNSVTLATTCGMMLAAAAQLQALASVSNVTDPRALVLMAAALTRAALAGAGLSVAAVQDAGLTTGDVDGGGITN